MQQSDCSQRRGVTLHVSTYTVKPMETSSGTTAGVSSTKISTQVLLSHIPARHLVQSTPQHPGARDPLLERVRSVSVCGLQCKQVQGIWQDLFLCPSARGKSHCLNVHIGTAEFEFMSSSKALSYNSFTAFTRDRSVCEYNAETPQSRRRLVHIDQIKLLAAV